uniref:Uncharacterized protein n=1 Tax=Oryza meridionalis TaxID=40149 RepID=A0A0E0CUN5_9ORYZ
MRRLLRNHWHIKDSQYCQPSQKSTAKFTKNLQPKLALLFTKNPPQSPLLQLPAEALPLPVLLHAGGGAGAAGRGSASAAAAGGGAGAAGRGSDSRAAAGDSAAAARGPAAGGAAGAAGGGAESGTTTTSCASIGRIGDDPSRRGIMRGSGSAKCKTLGYYP